MNSFLELQAQLEGTENRINESRLQYNLIVKYNVSVRRFLNIVAGVLVLRKRLLFQTR